MAEFYDDYLSSYDQGNSVPVVSPNRAGAWSQLNLASQSGSHSAPNSMYSQNDRSIRRKNSNRSNRRAFARTRNDDEEGYGSGGYDDGPLELTMIRVKVCSISFIFW
jgi:neutrophil factor 2